MSRQIKFCLLSAIIWVYRGGVGTHRGNISLEEFRDGV